jgi:hypothetical protein
MHVNRVAIDVLSGAGMQDPTRAARNGRAAAVAAGLALLVGAIVRLYPVHAPYPGSELQEGYARYAVAAFMAERWESPFKSHGTALFLLLRALLTGWYGIGRAVGLYAERPDLLASFVADPLPFIVAGRLVVIAAALWTIVLVGRLGRELFGAWAAVAAMLFLGVAFAHVRESHNVWPDVPSALVAVLAVIAALRAWQRPAVWPAALAGLTGGLAIAFKASVFPIALPVAIGAWGASPIPFARRAVRLGLAAIAALATNALLAPGRLQLMASTFRWMRNQALVTFTTPVPALPIPTYLHVGLGWPIVVLAVIGLAAALIRHRRVASILPATFGIVYAVVLLSAGYRFVRYLAILSPFVALYAGHGAAVLGAWAGARRAGAATAVVAVVAAAGQLVADVQWVAVLGRPDTRVLAGAWLTQHAAPGTRIDVPDVLACSTPNLPPDNRLHLTQFRGAVRKLAPYGFGLPGRMHPVQRIAFLGEMRPGWKPSPGFVVTASHPIVFPELDTPPKALAMLRAARARQVARFAGLEAPLPEGVLFDRIDADYVPLRGGQHVERPGPTLTIWQVPAPAPAARQPRRRARRVPSRSAQAISVKVRPLAGSQGKIEPSAR